MSQEYQEHFELELTEDKDQKSKLEEENKKLRVYGRYWVVSGLKLRKKCLMRGGRMLREKLMILLSREDGKGGAW
jgi:hypothetical protein